MGRIRIDCPQRGYQQALQFRRQMEGRKEWENRTNIKHKGSSLYGLPNSTSAVSFLKAQDLHHSPQLMDKYPAMFLSFGTFDCEVVVLENEFRAGQFDNHHLTYVERLRWKSHLPLTNVWLEFQYNDVSRKDYLIGFFLDIFSNLYSFNLSTYLEYNISIPGIPQPIKYTSLYHNLHSEIIKQASTVHLEYPLLLTKHRQLITTVNLAGVLRVFDLQKAVDKSQFATLLIKPEEVQLMQLKAGQEQAKAVCLAAAHNKTISSLGHVVVLALNNKQVPYVFVNCQDRQQYLEQIRQLNQLHTEWEDGSPELTFCQFDCTTNQVVCSTASQEIEIYEVKKAASLFYCQKVFRFHPEKSFYDLKFNIEGLSAGKGFLGIATCEEYVLFDLVTRGAMKRGKGNKESNRIDRLKWMEVLDRSDSYLAYVVIKGYNHLSQQQSKMGKPNVHFKTSSIAPKKN